MPRLSICFLVAISLCGCSYARKWTADREPPPGASIVSGASTRHGADEVTNPETGSEVELAGARDETGGPDEQIQPAVDQENHEEPRSSRWDSLLRAFGSPRRIPIPRTDGAAPPDNDPGSGPDFDGL